MWLVSFTLSLHILMILLLDLAFVLRLGSHVLSNSLLDANNILIFANPAIKCQVLHRTKLVQLLIGKSLRSLVPVVLFLVVYENVVLVRKVWQRVTSLH